MGTRFASQQFDLTSSPFRHNDHPSPAEIVLPRGIFLTTTRVSQAVPVPTCCPTSRRPRRASRGTRGASRRRTSPPVDRSARPRTGRSALLPRGRSRKRRPQRWPSPGCTRSRSSERAGAVPRRRRRGGGVAGGFVGSAGSELFRNVLKLSIGTPRDSSESTHCRGSARAPSSCR